MAEELDAVVVRDLDGTSAGIGHGLPGKSAAEHLKEAKDALNGLKSGTATVLAAGSTVDVDVGAAYDGKPAYAMVMQDPADGTLTSILRTSWDGSGVLTIHGNAAATADTVVSWFVDGRA